MTRGKTNERIRAARVEPSDYESAYRAIEVLQNLQTRPNESIKTLADIPDYTFAHHPDKETFGVRQILDIQDEQQTNGKIFKKFILGEYKFQTFRQIYKRIENIGRGLLSLNLTLGDKILIYSETRYEWLLTAFSAFRHGLTLVTLYSTLGEDAIKFGINQSKVKIVITSYELIPKLKNISDETEEVRYIIYFPPILKTESIKLPETKNNIQFISLDQLELAGSNALIDEDILKQRPAETDTAVIMYTSGSTGLPKGVLIRHENIIAGMTGQQSRLLSMVNVDTDIYIAYLPLAHILELCCEICMYYLGIKSGYSSPQTLTDQSTGIKQGAKGDLQILPRVEPSDYESAYRAIEVLQNLQTRPNESIKTLADIPDYTLVHHPDKETFGVRQILDIQDEQQTNGKIFKKFILGEYKFQTFRQIYKRIENIGRGLLSLNLTLGDKILIYSETRYEWLLTAFSAFRHGLTLVTLYSTLGEDAIKFGINQSKVKIVITSYELIPKLKNISDETEEVRYIIYFPPILKTESVKLPETKNNIQFISLDQLELNGSNAFIDEDILKQRPAETDTAVIMYTSGSTGLPKGVLIRHENIIAGMTGQQSRLLSMVNVDTDIYIAYLPLAHILELCCEICMYYLGIKSGYSSPQTLTDQSTGIKQGAKGDLQILRP
ncbi:unnamed protein product, partial [Adineta steineri]